MKRRRLPMAIANPNTPMIEKKKQTPANPYPIARARRVLGEVSFICDSPEAALHTSSVV
jgi:hypothetical protein